MQKQPGLAAPERPPRRHPRRDDPHPPAGVQGGSTAAVQFVLQGSGAASSISRAGAQGGGAAQSGLMQARISTMPDPGPGVTIERERATQLGISVSTIASSLQACSAASQTTLFLDRGERV